MTKPLDKENLRPLFSKIMQTHQLKPQDVKKKMSNIAFSDKGEFHCDRCVRTWQSWFSWVTFDLIELEVVYRWKMMCKFCLNKYEPTFTVDQLVTMFDTVVRFYKGESKSTNMGYSAWRNFHEPHKPQLCEKCCWGSEVCWRRKFHY